MIDIKNIMNNKMDFIKHFQGSKKLLGCTVTTKTCVLLWKLSTQDRANDLVVWSVFLTLNILGLTNEMISIYF